MVSILIWGLLILLLLIVTALLLRAHLRTPIRRYEGRASVAAVYDTWTNDHILEIYWGEHLHAGYYGDPPVKKDFIEAKIDFIDEMIKWGIAESNPVLFSQLENSVNGSNMELVKILDVGCGLGGSTRHMAKRWRQTAHVTGITISRAQARRATVLAKEQGVENAEFLECDALYTSFQNDGFDIVWAVESEMHVPDKTHFIYEMARVLKPGGALLIAAWNVRDTRNIPLSRSESQHLQLLVDEWAHAKFSSIQEYLSILEAQNFIEAKTVNWTMPTQPSWRHAIRVAVQDPRTFINISLQQRWRLIRDAYTILRYDEAFQKGLCEYRMMRGRKADG